MGGGQDGGDGGPDQQLSEQTVRSRFQQAASFLENADNWTGKKRVRLDMQVRDAGSVDGLDGQSGNFTMFVDAEDEVAIANMETRSGGRGPGTLVVAQVHKTSFMGNEKDGFLGIYNESAEPVDGLEQVDQPGSRSYSSTGTGSFLSVLNQTENIPPNASLTWELRTYEGKDALSLNITHENATSKTQLTWILWTDPDRPALVDGRVVDKESDATATVRVEFQYGDEATHHLESGLKRLESMTFLNQSQSSATSSGEGPYKNFTIQPSAHPGRVALEEATAVVKNNTGEASAEVFLELPLEEGSAQSEEVRLTFDDADGSGTVTPGDEFVMKQRDENVTLLLTVEDEKTGLVLLPAPGSLAGFAALATAALAARARRD